MLEALKFLFDCADQVLPLETSENMVSRIGMSAPDPQGVSTKQPSASARVTSLGAAYGGDAFSGGTARVTTLTSIAMQTPEIRQDLVEVFRWQVAAGQYPLDQESIADAMLNG